jgi:hypothetical protein
VTAAEIKEIFLLRRSEIKKSKWDENKASVCTGNSEN